MNAHRRITIAFFGIFLFVTAQIVWWNIFFARHSSKTVHEKLAQWQTERRMLAALYREQTPKQRKLLLAHCHALYRHLTCTPPDFAIRLSSHRALVREAHRHRRMFLFEGSFFFLVFIKGLLLLWQGVQTEQELKRRQQNFLSAVSHEMRTPISTMQLALDTLQMRKLPEEKRQRYIERLNKQLGRLQKTCEQVVAAAMLDHEEVQRTRALEDLNEKVEEVLEQSRAELEDRGARIEWKPTDAPLLVQLDLSALSLIVHNLLENAVKYNPKDEKLVRVVIQQRGGQAEVLIEDDGPGIPEGEQEKVFTPFYRVGQELTRKKDGLGLGLYLVRGLMETMQGQVRYEALEEGGSRFTLSWPLPGQGRRT